MIGLKRQIGRAIGPAIRRLTAGRARILMYHRPDSQRENAAGHAARFEQHLQYLRRNFNVRPLASLVARLEAGEPPEPKTVVVTVDDGYRDFHEVTYPALVRHEVPATVYVVSEFTSGRTWLWSDALRWLTMHAKPGTYRPSIAGVACEVRLGSHDERLQAWSMLAALLIRLEAIPRGQALAALQEQLSIELPARPVDEYASMDWDQVRALDPQLVEVGAHTRTHTCLSNCLPELQRDEIAGSKADIEREIGRPVVAFCYPNGMREDFTAQTSQLVRDCGFRSAVQAFGGLVGSDFNLFALSRLPVPTDHAQFRNCVNGAWWLRERVTGKATQI